MTWSDRISYQPKAEQSKSDQEADVLKTLHVPHAPAPRAAMNEAHTYHEEHPLWLRLLWMM
jgi:hypothetical protein